VINSKGDARRLLGDHRKLRSTQILLSRELGMTPAAGGAQGERQAGVRYRRDVCRTRPRGGDAIKSGCRERRCLIVRTVRIFFSHMRFSQEI
jgi:hypothetical protein